MNGKKHVGEESGAKGKYVLGFINFLKKTGGFFVRRNSPESDQTGASFLLTRENPPKTHTHITTG